MSSRGTSIGIGARSRKGLVLFWIALFVWSLAMQYVAAATPASVMAANPSANLDQCANDEAPSPSTDGCDTARRSGSTATSARASRSTSKATRSRIASTFGDLARPQSHTVTIEWDTTKSGKHALDYLTTFNRVGRDANPCLGVIGCGSVGGDYVPDPCRPADRPATASRQVAGDFTHVRRRDHERLRLFDRRRTVLPGR